MSAAAWVTLAATWTVIGFFTIRFFLMVIRTPDGSPGEEGEAEPGAVDPEGEDG